MPRTVRTLTVAILACLATATAAQAATPTPPSFAMSPFTKPVPDLATGDPVVELHWAPALFSPATADDKQMLSVYDVGNGTVVSTLSPTASSYPAPVTDGHRYEFTVAGCVSATGCGPADPSAVAETRIDATPPSGTVQIAAGAAFTAGRTVTLALAATDPLIGGASGTSSGVTQYAADVDGDGTSPCVQGGDTSGCAADFAPAVTATLPDGPDGLRTVGVRFGDGARVNTWPCPPMSTCMTAPPGSILGNASPEATDTILLDTTAPVAAFRQGTTSVSRGVAISFDSAGSIDPGTATTASGIDPAGAIWSFADGSAPVTGESVTHAFATAGTFLGALRVRDRAGNLSEAVPFSVIVTPEPGETTDGAGGIAGVSGTAAFSIARLKATARYTRSRLTGSVVISGRSTVAGAFRAELRRTARGPVLGRLSTTVPAAPFARTLRLPATLAPGVYRLSFTGPGGTLTTTLTITAPRVGVVSAAAVTASRARFTFAARPVVALRRRLTVAWSLSGRSLGVTRATGGRVVTAHLPPGARLRAGRLTATLRVGRTVVGSGRVRVR